LTIHSFERIERYKILAGRRFRRQQESPSVADRRRPEARWIGRSVPCEANRPPGESKRSGRPSSFLCNNSASDLYVTHRVGRSNTTIPHDRECRHDRINLCISGMIPSFTDVERTKNRPRKAWNDTEKAHRHMGIRSRRWALFATPSTDVAPFKIREVERTCNAQASDDRNWLEIQVLELRLQTARPEAARFA
jgi:hypothetical protein